jgi:hypothetical protein
MATTKIPANITPLFCTLDDAQTISGISKWTWRQKAYSGEVESSKVGRRLLIPIAEVKRLIEEGRRPRRDGLPAGAPSQSPRRRRMVVAE